jgi:hypothetical protein
MCPCPLKYSWRDVISSAGDKSSPKYNGPIMY